MIRTQASFVFATQTDATAGGADTGYRPKVRWWTSYSADDAGQTYCDFADWTWKEVAEKLIGGGVTINAETNVLNAHLWSWVKHWIFRNNGNSECRLIIWTCKAKENDLRTAQNVLTAAQTISTAGAGTTTYEHTLDLSDLAYFKQYAKILKKKLIVFPPGACYELRWKVRIPFVLNTAKIYHFGVSAGGTNYSMRNGMMFMVFRLEGCPSHVQSGTEGKINTTAADHNFGPAQLDITHEDLLEFSTGGNVKYIQSANDNSTVMSAQPITGDEPIPGQVAATLK